MNVGHPFIYFFDFMAVDLVLTFRFIPVGFFLGNAEGNVFMFEISYCICSLLLFLIFLDYFMYMYLLVCMSALPVFMCILGGQKSTLDPYPFPDLGCSVSRLSSLIIMLTVGFCVVCLLVDTVCQVEEARYFWASC